MKAGWKTTEFWASISTALIGVLVLFGFFTQADAGEFVNGVNNIVGGVMSIAPIIGYSLSRGRAKATTPQNGQGVNIKQVTETLNLFRDMINGINKAQSGEKSS